MIEPQHCYVCKQRYVDDPSVLRPAVPRLRRLQLPQAHRDRRPERPRRAAHRRPRQDRLPGRDQAAAGRRAADRHDALPARLRRRATRRSPTSSDWGDRLEIFGLDLRHTPSVEAFCAAPQRDARPARLHRQQRLPDRAPAGRTSTATCWSARLPSASTHARRRSGGCSAPTRACAATTSCPADGEPTLAAGRRDARGRAVAGAAAAGRPRRAGATSSRRGASTRTCSRSTCASATRGGCCSPRSRRSSCSRRSSSTRSRRSS